MMGYRVFWLLLSTYCCWMQVSEANVYFRLAFNFKIQDADDNANATDASGNGISIEVGNVKASSESVETTDSAISTATVGPYMAEVWAQQSTLNETALDKLQLTRTAIEKLNLEISPLVSQSDYIATKMRHTNSYLREVEALTPNVGNTFEVLRKFVNLVNELQAPPTSEEEDGPKSMANLLMKLIVEKYDLPKLQVEVQSEVLQAEQTWQKYVKSKLVEV